MLESASWRRNCHVRFLGGNRGVSPVTYPIANVHILVFNTLGKKVRTLVDDHQEPGQHRIIWNGQDDSGHQVSSGVYLFRVRVGDFYEMKKMIMIK